MSSFVPENVHLRHALLFLFNQKKKAAESHRLLVETYGEHALTIKTCETWFRKFKSGDFDLQDKERSGRPKKFEDAKLQELLDEDPSQTQKQLAEALNVAQETISDRLRAMEKKIQKMERGGRKVKLMDTGRRIHNGGSGSRYRISSSTTDAGNPVRRDEQEKDEYRRRYPARRQLQSRGRGESTL